MCQSAPGRSVLQALSQLHALLAASPRPDRCAAAAAQLAQEERRLRRGVGAHIVQRVVYELLDAGVLPDGRRALLLAHERAHVGRVGRKQLASNLGVVEASLRGVGRRVSSRNSSGNGSSMKSASASKVGARMRC